MLGRPSKYKSEYCDKLIEHMRNGKSFESFGAVAHATEETLNNWCRKHPDFLRAKELGKVYEREWWENTLRLGAQGQMPPIQKRTVEYDADGNVVKSFLTQEPGKYNSASVHFSLKNKFPKQWRDKTELEVTSGEELSNLSSDEIKRRKELYASLVKKNES